MPLIAQVVTLPSRRYAARGIDLARGALRMDWQNWGLPDSVAGKTFLDVGCWEGAMCLEATKRGAATALGVDYCTSPEAIAAQEQHGLDFLQLDIMSEKALQLPEFDIVLCAGVLYHVESPLALLFRLRKLCRPGGRLFLETTCFAGSSEPIMLFHPGDSFDDNPSNWWTPTESCLVAMLTEAGFGDVVVTCRQQTVDGPIGRICVGATSVRTPATMSAKILPHRPPFMPSAPHRGSRLYGR